LCSQRGVISVYCGTVTVAVARLRAAVALKLKLISVSLLILFYWLVVNEKFNAGCAPEKWGETSRVKTPKRNLKLPVAPEPGQIST
jgi:hypothetical protein